MNNCFALRFNLQKSGYEFDENLDVFAKMFCEERQFIEETLSQYDKINSDAAENIKKSSTVNLSRLEGKKVLLCGDSNTSDRLSWGKFVSKILPCTIIDGAVSGWRSVQLMSELDRLLQTTKPDIVVVMIGNNDSFFCDKEAKIPCTTPAEFKRNLTTIAKKTKTFKAQLIINSIVPSWCETINKTHPFWSATEENNELFNSITKSVCEDVGCVYFDFRTEFIKENYEALFYRDGTHLTPLAHSFIAKNFIHLLGELYGNN